MLPAAHFSVGMIPPFLVSAAIYIKRKGKVTFRYLIWTPIAMFLGGVWALGPDWCRYIAILLRKNYRYSSEAHQPGWPDIFFFHGRLDLAGHTGAVLGTVAILFMFSCLIFVYLKQIWSLMRYAHRLEKKIHKLT